MLYYIFGMENSPKFAIILIIDENEIVWVMFKTLFFQVSVGFALLPNLASAKCADILKYAALDVASRESYFASNSEDRRRVCSEYNSLSTDDTSSSAEVIYGAFGGFGSFSRDKLDSIASYTCDERESEDEKVAIDRSFVRGANPKAYDAYLSCVEFSNRDVEIIERRSANGKKIQVGFKDNSYHKRLEKDRVEINWLDYDTSFLECNGALSKASNGETTIVLDDKLVSMICTRKIHDTNEPLAVIAEAATISFTTNYDLFGLDLIERRNPPPIPPTVSGPSCFEFREGKEDQVACSTATSEGFYWSIGRKIRHYPANGIKGVGKTPACNLESIGKSAQTYRFPLTMPHFEAPREQYEALSNNNTAPNCDRSSQHAPDGIDRSNICGIFEVTCQRQAN